MRGLCRLAAGLLSVACATKSFVLPADEAVDALHDAPRHTLAAEQVSQLPNGDAGVEVERLDLSQANLAAHNKPDDENEEAVLIQHWRTWLDELETDPVLSESPSLLSAIPTTTSAAFNLLSRTSDDINAVLSSTAAHISQPPGPTPLDWYPFGGAHQHPLGDWAETWQAAKSKVHSVVALVASHITECPTKATQVQSAPSSTGSYTSSSTISARTVEPLATAVPDSHPAVAAHPEASQQFDIPAHDHDVHHDELDPISAVEAVPALQTTQPSPAHMTASSYPTSTSQPISTPTVDQISSASVAAAEESTSSTYLDVAADPRYAAAIAVPILATLILSAIIFFILVHRNPRRRAERAARCEERKNRHLYRRAFYRHKMETLMTQVTAYPPFRWLPWRSAQDLAEKGLLESVPEDTSLAGPSNGVSEEILSFREAHQMVDSLVRAEEGGSWSSRDRRRTYMWLFGGRARRQRALSNASSDLSDSEKTAPPPYDERENYEKLEPASYTRRVARNQEDCDDSDKSSVSSIIPTSTRHSAYTYSAGDPDSDKE